MKLGAISFSYAAFHAFRDAIARSGHSSINLGDFAQTIAAHRLFTRLGYSDSAITRVDRDTLADYKGEQVALLMNAVFRPECFPIPEAIIPIFMGFTARPETIASQIDYLKSHQPIGCRDSATAERLRSLGVEAFASGCVTLTLPPRRGHGPKLHPFIVYGTGAGELPTGLLSRMPVGILDAAEFVFHRFAVFGLPLLAESQYHLERYEENLIHRLSYEANLVITPLHHVAAPCMAMGIPVILCRRAHDESFHHDRFSFLRQIVSVHTPETFDQIDWSPQPVSVTQHADAFIEGVRERLPT